MKTIQKFTVPYGTDSLVHIPHGWAPLHVGIYQIWPDRQGDPCLWVLADAHPEAEQEEVSLSIFSGTGEEVPDGLRHLGSVIDSECEVWHVFFRPSLETQPISK